MRGVLEEYFDVVMEILSFALVLGLIIIFVSMGKSAVAAKEYQDAAKTELTGYREFFIYDNRYVTGNDILAFVNKYPRIYDVYIGRTGEALDSMFSVRKAAETNEDAWTMGYLLDYLEDDVNLVYKADLIRDGTNVITGVQFATDSEMQDAISQ